MYYANLLDQLRPAIREKRRGKLSKGVLLQQNNARVHTCKVAMDAVERIGYELIRHPAYLPDLAPSDFFLFPNLNKSTSSIIAIICLCIKVIVAKMSEKKMTEGQITLVTIICLCIKVIVVKMSGKKMTEGQITIQNQILIISMDR